MIDPYEGILRYTVGGPSKLQDECINAERTRHPAEDSRRQDTQENDRQGTHFQCDLHGFLSCGQRIQYMNCVFTYYI